MPPELLNVGLSVLESIITNEPAIAAELTSLFSKGTPPTLEQLQAFRARVVLKTYASYDPKPLPAGTNIIALPAAKAVASEAPVPAPATNPPPTPPLSLPSTPSASTAAPASLPAGPSTQVVDPLAGAGASGTQPSAPVPAPAAHTPAGNPGLGDE